MTSVAMMTFSPFQENTYVLYDDTKECVIIDPGCYSKAEKEELKNFITNAGLTPVKLLLTHAHLDHVFGNKYVFDTFGLQPILHKGEVGVLNSAAQVGAMYGVPTEPSPAPLSFLEEGDVVEFGTSKLEVLFTPGHSPASIAFYCRDNDFIIAGDVLFRGSIGRTDLPGGNFNTLIESIKTKLFPLDDKTTVYSGHGTETTIGWEKKTNPFLT